MKKQKNLATANKRDFTILRDGEAYISQLKLAALCGVSQGNISQAISRGSSYVIGANLNDNNQLDYNSAFNVILHHAMSGKSPAIATLGLIGSGGMKAYIYHEAGYQFDARPREDLLKNKRLAQHIWSDALQIQRRMDGKDTKPYHYSNENLMLNQVVLGERRSFQEDELVDLDVEKLEEARTLNGALIKLGVTYKERKESLLEWSEKQEAYILIKK